FDLSQKSCITTHMHTLLGWLLPRLLLARLPLARLLPAGRPLERARVMRLALSAPVVATLVMSVVARAALAAAPLASPSQLCEAAIVTAERAERLPERMTGAIAVV